MFTKNKIKSENEFNKIFEKCNRKSFQIGNKIEKILKSNEDLV